MCNSSDLGEWRTTFLPGKVIHTNWLKLGTKMLPFEFLSLPLKAFGIVACGLLLNTNHGKLGRTLKQHTCGCYPDRIRTG